MLAEGDNKDGKTTIVKIKKVQRLDEWTWFSFPDEHQTLDHHKLLLDVPSVKSAVAAIKSRSQYRNVMACLPDQLLKTYTDTDGNFVFKEFFLAETLPTPTPGSSSSDSELISCLTKISKKEETIKEIMQHLFIEKFSSKNQNVLAWCDVFEKESLRFKLTGTRPIEVFKSCLEPSMNDWFLVTQKKIGLEAAWSVWKSDLISTFSDMSWRPIRYTYNFKYLSGSYVDFVVKKEKMLLELDQKIPDNMLLNLLVLGLPSNIQNNLNRTTITSTKTLIAKLKKYDLENVTSSGNKPQKSTFYNPSHKVNNNGNNFTKSVYENSNSKKFENENNVKPEKKPCSICAKRGYSERFHPEINCWFKDKDIPKRTVNKVELESLSSSEDESKNWFWNHWSR